MVADIIRSNWASGAVMYSFIPKYVPRTLAFGRSNPLEKGWFFLMG